MRSGLNCEPLLDGEALGNAANDGLGGGEEATSPSRATVSVKRMDVYWLSSTVGMVNHPGSDGSACVVAAPERHVQALLDEVGVLDPGDGPTHDHRMVVRCNIATCGTQLTDTRFDGKGPDA